MDQMSADRLVVSSLLNGCLLPQNLNFHAPISDLLPDHWANGYEQDAAEALQNFWTILATQNIPPNAHNCH